MYGFKDPRLIETPLPYFAVPLWQSFWMLHDTRQGAAMGGLQPISYLEIDAYSRLMQVSLEPWEVEIVKRMDNAFLTAINTRVGDK